MPLRMPQIGHPLIIFLISAFLAATANLRFFEETVNVYPVAENWPFLVSAAIVLTCAIALVTALLSLLFPIKAVGIGLFMLAAVVGHFSDTLGITIDTEMIRNTLYTDAAEAGDMVSMTLGLRILVLGIVPSVVLWFLPIKPCPLRWRQARVAAAALGAVAVTVAVILPFSDTYASYFREHKPLRYYTNPTYPIYSAVKFALENGGDVAQDHTVETRMRDAALPDGDKAHDLVILVLGETARADHFGLNGYARSTTPNLSSRQDLVSFSNMRSCGTSTAISVPCLFSLDPRESFDIESARWTENTVDVLARAGVTVLWRDNNSGPQGVADRVGYQMFTAADVNPICDVECRDEGMLSGLDDYLDTQKNDVLIVLHQKGSHGPAYFKRYPEAFRRFTPDCRDIDLGKCSAEEIVNAYDNTILYTDHFLDRVIALLQRHQDRYEPTMLYVSDHGESLGELGIFLHGMPYFMAPDAQTHVPFIVWAAETSDVDREKLVEIKDRPATHDDLSRILLQLFEIEIGDVRPEPVKGVMPMSEHASN